MPQPDVALYRQTKQQTLTIGDAGTVSDAFDARGYALFGAVIPAGFEGTSLMFQVSADGSTFVALDDGEGAAVSLVVAASKAYALPDALAGWPYFKLVADAQTGAAAIVVTRKG